MWEIRQSSSLFTQTYNGLRKWGPLHLLVNAKNKISSNQNLVDSSDESAIIEISDNESEEKPQKKINKTINTSKIKNTSKLINKNQIISIKSDQYAEPEFFNDYMIEFEREYGNTKIIMLWGKDIL